MLSSGSHCYHVLVSDSGSVTVPEQEAIVTSEELGQDLEHVEVLQKKFEEFQTDMAAHEERVNEVNQFAGKLIQVNSQTLCASQHPFIYCLVFAEEYFGDWFPNF